MVKTEDKGKRTGVHLNFFLQCTPRMKYVVLLLIQNNMFLRLGVQNILICQKWCWEIGQTVESKDQFLSGTYMEL